jgi:TRAP-type C4-dicarboxylate transport system substrate-binding protein
VKQTILILGALILAAPSCLAGPAPAVPVKIRWVLAHQPLDVFRRAAEVFQKEVAEKSGHRLEVEVLTVTEYSAKYNEGKLLDPSKIIEMVQKNKIEMSQMYTTALGSLSRDMYALDMPFLFRDHEHASKVLDGEIGSQLLAGLDKSHLRGLAFTYSGGYRIIPANKAIHTVEDFKGMSIRTAPSPVAEDVITALGAHPVPMDLESIDQATKSGKIQGAESTFIRVYGMHQNKTFNVINDTRHSLFLTTIILSPQLWEKLDPSMQTVVKNAAEEAAKVERKESIADVETTKLKCEHDGLKVVELSATEQGRFKTAMNVVYDKYKNYFTPNLIQRINQTR